MTALSLSLLWSEFGLAERWLLLCSSVEVRRVYGISGGHLVFIPFLPAELPYNDYFEYFGPDFKLHISPSNMTNQNTNEYLEKIK